MECYLYELISRLLWGISSFFGLLTSEQVDLKHFTWVGAILNFNDLQFPNLWFLSQDNSFGQLFSFRPDWG